MYFCRIAALEKVSSGVFAVNETGNVVYANQAFSKLVGLDHIPDNELFNSSLENTLRSKSKRPMAEKFIQRLKNGVCTAAETSFEIEVEDSMEVENFVEVEDSTEVENSTKV